MMEPRLWRTAKIGQWSDRSEHITVKEGRCLIIAMRRLSRDSTQRGRRVCMLVDNLALAMAISKGRAHNYTMLRICQQYSALCLACNLGIKVRWIPSETNPADGPSRGSLMPGSSWEAASELRGFNHKPEDDLGELGCFAESEPEVDHPGGGGKEWSSEAAGAGPEGSCGMPEGEFKISKSAEGEENPECGSLAHSTGSRKAAGDTGAWRIGRGVHGTSYDEARKEECEQSAADPVPQVPQLVQGLLLGVRRDMAPERVRLDPCRLLRRHVLGRELPRHRTEGFSRSGVRVHREEGAACPLTEGVAGVAKAEATSESATASKAPCLRDGADHHGEGASRDGAEACPRLRPVPQTKRGHGPPGEACGSTSPRRRSPVQEVRCHHPGPGLWEAGQDRGVRQHAAARQSGDGEMARANASQPGNPAGKGASSLLLFAGGVSQGVRQSGSLPGGERPSDVPASSWGSLRGPEQPRARSRGGSRKREMEDGHLRPPICEDRETSEAAARTGEAQLGVLSPEPAGSTKNLARFGESKTSVSGDTHETKQWWTASGPIVLEIFSGVGRLTRSLCELGIQAFGIDIVHGPMHDVLDPMVQARLFRLIRKGQVQFVWLGMPCTTFSIARRNDGIGPPPLRSDSRPHGLPNLAGGQLQKLREGNALFGFSMDLIKECQRCKIPWALENPATSRCWLMPRLRALLPKVSSILLDFCCFGEAWRKRTRIIHQGISLASLEILCSGTHGNCSRTGKPHLHLKGIAPNGQFWTLTAQPYPIELTRRLAHELSQQMSASG